MNEVCVRHGLIGSALLGMCLVASTVCAQPHDYDSVGKRQASIARVVAKVGEVWSDPARLPKLHKELTEKYPGTPPLEQFLSEERWVVVVSASHPLLSGVYKGRSKASMGVAVGDIVELSVGKGPKVAKSYDELGSVDRVVCKAAAPEYRDCIVANPLVWLDAAGNKVEQFVLPAVSFPAK